MTLYRCILWITSFFKNFHLIVTLFELVGKLSYYWQQYCHRKKGSQESPKNTNASLQIIFPCQPVICQATDKVWPDLQPVWSDKRRRENDMYASDAFSDPFLRQWHFKKCLLNYLMKTACLLYEYWQEQLVYVYRRHDTRAVNESKWKCITAIILKVHLRINFVFLKRKYILCFIS